MRWWEMSKCIHDLAERETACNDGLCPICLQQENAELNIILFHCDNGLSHPDLQEKIDKAVFRDLQEDIKIYHKINEELSQQIKTRDEKIAELVIENANLKKTNHNLNITIEQLLVIYDGITDLTKTEIYTIQHARKF
jgi:tRNA G18 (ribose-2'-O)-methylase SpoU